MKRSFTSTSSRCFETFEQSGFEIFGSSWPISAFFVLFKCGHTIRIASATGPSIGAAGA